LVSSARISRWVKPAPRESRGVSAKYAKTVHSASEGNGLKAFRKRLGQYLLQIVLFAEFLVPFVLGRFAALANFAPVLSDLGTVNASLVVMQNPFYAFESLSMKRTLCGAELLKTTHS
jgi:hypothetical protein